MNRILLLLTAITLTILTSCQSDGSGQNGADGKKVDSQISDLESKMALEDTPEPKELKQLIKLYEEHVNQYPERREVNANFLMKAADCARMMGDDNKAIAMYDRIINEFIGTVQSPRALFLKGFLYDTKLNRKDSALLIYRTFLWRYKNDPFTDDVQQLADTLSKQYPDIAEKVDKKERAGSIIGSGGQKKPEEKGQGN